MTIGEQLNSIVEDTVTKIQGILWDDLSNPDYRRQAAGLIRDCIEWRYFPSPRQRVETGNSILVYWLDAVQKKYPGMTVAEFADHVAAINAMFVPKGEQRGPFTTDAATLDHHVRRERRKRRHRNRK